MTDLAAGPAGPMLSRRWPRRKPARTGPGLAALLLVLAAAGCSEDARKPTVTGGKDGSAGGAGGAGGLAAAGGSSGGAAGSALGGAGGTPAAGGNAGGDAAADSPADSAVVDAPVGAETGDAPAGELGAEVATDAGTDLGTDVGTDSGVEAAPACGGAGEPCCRDKTCNSGGCCIFPVGGVEGRCRASGSACGEGLAGVCEAGSCGPAGMKCGQIGQTCCPLAGINIRCTGSGAACRSGMCVACGAPGQPCCGDGIEFYLTCQPGSTCAGAGLTCQPCGGLDQPCCLNDSPECREGRVCTGQIGQRRCGPPPDASPG